MLVWFLLIFFFTALPSLALEGDYEVVVPKLEARLGTLPVHNRKARSASNVTAQQEDVLIYTLTAFGESVRLHLRRNHDFIATSLVVEYHKREGKRKLEPGDHYALRRCFYSGFAAGHNGGIDTTPAAFSVCGGLSGAYTTTRGQFFVEPLGEKINRSSSDGQDAVDRPHVVYKRKPVNSAHSSHCGLAGRLSHDVPQLSEKLKRRRRSQSMENYIETLMVADQEMYKFHKHKTEHYLLVVSSVVAHLFQDPTLQNFVRVVVVRMVILEENPITLDASSSAGYYLSSFCRWQAAVNYDSHHELHHDTALLFTRNNICKTSTRCDTLGLAELGTICDSAKSCAINEDNGLSVALTAAHELGHILNIPHDGAAADCHLKPNEYRLMAPTLSSHTKPWSWSQCSSRALTRFLDGGNGICLLDRPGKVKKVLTEELPGQLFNLDQQCELAFGPGIQTCKYIQDQIPCKRLWCSTSTPGCRTRHMPWAEGTSCGHNKWCWKGKCIAKETNDIPVDGGWGQWGTFNKCTRTCGGGVQFSERECNQPIPANGGQYCVGQRRQHRSCNTQKCPSGSTPFRELQCRSFNGRKHNFNDLPYNVNWSPKYNMRPSDVCKLFCYADANGRYYRLAAKVIDGTPCRPDSLDMCVDGQCRPAGCDHVLGSDARLDKCGVCGGNGQSCKQVSDSVQKAGHYGYNEVMTFPVGATSIQVHQPPLFRRDDNYLALRGDTGKYMLNGRFQISVGRMKYNAAGTVWYYNGSQTGLETLSTSGPLKEAVTLLVLSVGTEKMFKLDWVFNSLVMRRTYHWAQGDWQDCSSDCQGYQEKRVECRRNGQVSLEVDEMCNSTSKPKPDSRQCNTNCSYEWVTARSHCSTTCGPGVQNEIPTCVRRQPGTQVQVIAAKHCSSLRAPPSRIVSCEVKACVHDQAKWREYEWSPCSVSCGGGVQYRKVRCVNFKLWQLLAEKECAATPKPATERKCNERPCTDYHWIEGSWGTCSQTCDVGIQQRTLTCSDQNGQPVSARYCSSLQRPAATQECITQRCTHWRSGEWSKCSSSCGAGYQTRSVSCVDVNGHVVSTRNCSPFSKPDERQLCLLQDCPSGQWRLSGWSSCSASCGHGIRTRRVICVDGQGRELGDDGCNGSNKPTEEREACVVHTSCYKWNVSEWGQCSRKCGGGKARRTVECQTLNGLRLDDNRCSHARKPSTTKLCNQAACPRWKKLSWGRCSVTCGRGKKQRSVLCIGYDGKHLPENECKLKKKPRLVKSCESLTCPQWKMGAWSSCSKSCGEGVQTRKVECWRKQRVDESKCSESPPLSSRLCETQKCSFSFSWDIGQWEPCSVTCGNGVTTRTVRCLNEATKELVGIDQCEAASRPRNTFVCVSRTTCPGHWAHGNWSQCSSTCGRGVQTRTVDCISGDQVVSPSYCNSSQMPSRSQSCDKTPCDEVIWYYGDWMDCDRSCGGGIQRRQHYCGYVHSQQTRLPDQLCIEKHGMPVSHQPCSSLTCPSGVHRPSSCQQVKLQKLGNSDGTYSISTGGGGVLQIYCHAMGTADPKEFITLAPSAHNFAEIYHLALRDPSTCPTVLHSNVVNQHHYPSKGRTIFSRVRIDVQSMELIANDYTFATTRNSSSGRPIEYGSAGDCFSKSGQCPKGKFRVDLQHTGLKVDPSNRWHKHGSPGSNTVMSIDMNHNNQVVEGKCGGHCGRCYSEASKIKVQIV